MQLHTVHIFRGPRVAPNLASPAWEDPEKSAVPSGVHAGSAAVLEHVHESPPIAVEKEEERKMKSLLIIANEHWAIPFELTKMSPKSMS